MTVIQILETAQQLWCIAQTLAQKAFFCLCLKQGWISRAESHLQLFVQALV